jgi:hypothetical protein
VPDASEDVARYVRDQAVHLSTPSDVIAAATLRSGSAQGVELLALKATGGRSTYDDLLVEIRTLLAAGSAGGAAPFDVDSLASLARVAGGRPGPGRDFTESADLHQAVRLLRTGDVLDEDVDRLDAQTNLAVGRFEYVDAVLPELDIGPRVRWMLETELLHPDLGRPGSTREAWLESFNEPFAGRELSAVEIQDGEGTAFDRLHSQAAHVVEDGPLVTIIMSVYQPDQSLITSITSLIAQTWRNLEILVVDDCSPPEFRDLIEAAVALDDRIQLLTMPSNGGTYKIRNYAMARAQGEFIGFQDSDDWSHPERIEAQLVPLLKKPKVMATLSRAIRVSADLSLNTVGYPAVRPNASSLLFRRVPVLEALGGYDVVRKAADTEFELRIRLAFGEKSVAQRSRALALVQLTHGSLSRNDFQLGNRDAARSAYRDAYQHWHTLIAAGSESVRLDPEAPRRFPAPARLLLGSEAEPSRTDVLVVADWRSDDSLHAGSVPEVAALVDKGLSTAVVHAEPMSAARLDRVPPDAALMAMRAAGSVAGPLWRDDVRASLIFVQDPELLAYPRPADDVGLRADRVVIRADRAPRGPEGWLAYEPAVIERYVRELFDADAAWLPADTEVAGALAHEGAGVVLAPTPLGGSPDAFAACITALLGDAAGP